jgi:hypothetical protein
MLYFLKKPKLFLFFTTLYTKSNKGALDIADDWDL